MTDVPVPDIPAGVFQRERLCWQQDPATMTRCDRRLDHAGLHTWEWAAITVSLAEAEADLAALKGRACDCCTFRWPGNTRDRDVCGKVSIPGHSVAVVLCDQLHRTCGAWAAKETP